MTDWSRLTDYIFDFFPDNSHTEQEISDWAMINVPAWKYMDSQTRDGILGDWRHFVDSEPPSATPEPPTAPIHPPPLPPPTPRPPPARKPIGARIKAFFKRIFRR